VEGLPAACGADQVAEGLAAARRQVLEKRAGWMRGVVVVVVVASVCVLFCPCSRGVVRMSPRVG
jgi:hypothetical protein